MVNVLFSHSLVALELLLPGMLPASQRDAAPAGAVVDSAQDGTASQEGGIEAEHAVGDGGDHDYNSADGLQVLSNAVAALCVMGGLPPVTGVGSAVKVVRAIVADQLPPPSASDTGSTNHAPTAPQDAHDWDYVDGIVVRIDACRGEAIIAIGAPSQAKLVTLPLAHVTARDEEPPKADLLTPEQLDAAMPTFAFFLRHDVEVPMSLARDEDDAGATILSSHRASSVWVPTVHREAGTGDKRGPGRLSAVLEAEVATSGGGIAHTTNGIAAKDRTLAGLTLYAALRAMALRAMAQLLHRQPAAAALARAGLLPRLLQVATADVHTASLCLPPQRPLSPPALPQHRVFVGCNPSTTLFRERVSRVVDVVEVQAVAQRAWDRLGTTSITAPVLTRDTHCPSLEALGGDLHVNGDRVRALSSFPTVRLAGVCLQPGSGVWYYEAMLLSDGLMQLGWADFGLSCDAAIGNGVGDDSHSWAYDGWRCRAWHKPMPNGDSDDADDDNGVNAARRDACWSHYGHRWSAGDVVGCIIDTGASEAAYQAAGGATVYFTLNGRDLGAAFTDVTPEGTGRPRPATAASVATTATAVTALTSSRGGSVRRGSTTALVSETLHQELRTDDGTHHAPSAAVSATVADDGEPSSAEQHADAATGGSVVTGTVMEVRDDSPSASTTAPASQPTPQPAAGQPTASTAPGSANTHPAAPPARMCGWFPAASANLDQQLEFNFGTRPFAYPLPPSLVSRLQCVSADDGTAVVVRSVAAAAATTADSLTTSERGAGTARGSPTAHHSASAGAGPTSPNTATGAAGDGVVRGVGGGSGGYVHRAHAAGFGSDGHTGASGGSTDTPAGAGGAASGGTSQSASRRGADASGVGDDDAAGQGEHQSSGAGQTGGLHHEELARRQALMESLLEMGFGVRIAATVGC